MIYACKDMKIHMLYFLALFNTHLCAQDNNLFKYKKNIDTDLKTWTLSINNFRITDFKPTDTLLFANDFPQDSSRYKQFLSVHKPIVSYSPDKTKFIDLYSIQLGLEKKGNYFLANIEADQSVTLFDEKANYWNRIFFGSTSYWIDDVSWVSSVEFILAGIEVNEDETKKPFFLLGNTKNQTLIRYIPRNKSCLQNDKKFISPKLKKIPIKGL
ncbi:MAG: hypothetical protein ACRCVT_00635 [Leadbetterella sp.]